MRYSPLLEQLIGALRALPGVGARSAQRMAFHLLERDRPGGRQLAAALEAAMEGVGRCADCRMYTEEERCPICSSPRRDASQLCVVESPADVVAIEASTAYSGVYYVLMGRLSPLDGIGPQELGLDRLEERLRRGEVTELILATNPTVEGEATAHYLAELARANRVQVSRIAHGVPMGGELEYVDGGTLAHAFQRRQELP